MNRHAFLDVLRGVALIAMVLNHTGHWWIGRPMGWGRVYVVYVTVTIAAPIFLFLVGFVLTISLHRYATAPMPVSAWLRYARRGAGVAALGYLLNLLVFPTDPILLNEVLHTIGVSIVLAPLLVPALRHRVGLVAVLVVAVGAYAVFVIALADIAAWTARHPTGMLVFFGDYAWWPWTSIVAIGLVLGWSWREALARNTEHRFFAVLCAAGAAMTLAAAGVELLSPSTPRVAFTRDLLLNHYWIPAPITAVRIVGEVVALLAAFWWVFEVRGVRAEWLVVLGRTALMLYFVHQIIVLTIVHERLGVTFHAWWPYWVANAVLVAALLGLGHAWLWLKARAAVLLAARQHAQPA